MKIFALAFLALLFSSGKNSFPKEYRELDRLAVEAGTDKSSLFHNYTEVYARYFAPLREKSIKFLEIGIYQGNSVKLWEHYFPKAELHFIDINPENIIYYSPKAKYHFFDQANVKSLEAFVQEVGGGFDVIIDDGGHEMQQQIISFETLFPHLKSGGMYILEDLHTSYWKKYGGNGTCVRPKAGTGTAVEFFKSLVEDLNYTAARTRSANGNSVPSDVLTEYQKNIFSIHFYKSLCIIIKR